MEGAVLAGKLAAEVAPSPHESAGARTQTPLYNRKKARCNHRRRRGHHHYHHHRLGFGLTPTPVVPARSGPGRARRIGVCGNVCVCVRACACVRACM